MVILTIVATQPILIVVQDTRAHRLPTTLMPSLESVSKTEGGFINSIGRRRHFVKDYLEPVPEVAS